MTDKYKDVSSLDSERHKAMQDISPTPQKIDSWEEQLKQEFARWWKKGIADEEGTDIVADWWIEILSSHHASLIEKVEKLRNEEMSYNQHKLLDQVISLINQEK